MVLKTVFHHRHLDGAVDARNGDALRAPFPPDRPFTAW